MRIVMDDLAKRLARYSASFSYDLLPKEVIHEAKRRIIDAFGCAIGAYGSLPGKIVQSAAIPVKSSWKATVFGTPWKSSPDLAAFASGTFVRYLDFNDTYLSLEPAHPSDNIPAALAVVEAEGLRGQDLIAAMVLGYEIQCRLCDGASLRKRGWDHVTYGALSTTLLSGWLMRLNENKLSHAVSLAAVCNNALRQTRVGEISLWKAAAFANAARNGVFAASLARIGMTGPERIFEGEKGYFRTVSGPFTLPLLGGEKNTPFKILESYIKFYPVEYHAQSAVAAALLLYQQIERHRSDFIRSVLVKTSAISHEIIGSDQEKWRPKTRETADHSLPFCVAVALSDGTLGLEQFDDAHRGNKNLLALVQKVVVVKDDALSGVYPDVIGNQVEITTRSGNYVQRVDHPRGHPRNPMTDAEVEEKFISLAQGKLPSRRINRILESLWSLEKIKNIGTLLSYFTMGSR